MTTARVAAVVIWAHAAGFGLPAIPVAVYLLRRGALPTFFNLFPMYGGPWFDRFGHRTFVALLGAFLVVALADAAAAWLVWNGYRTGVVASVALMVVEAVFWLGFALPIPWVLAVARVALLALAWRSLR